MMYAFRQGLICLLLLWLPASWATESGWLRSPQNDHASVRLRADTSAQGETRLLIDVKLENGWKTYWRSPGEGGISPCHCLARRDARGGLVLADTGPF